MHLLMFKQSGENVVVAELPFENVKLIKVLKNSRVVSLEKQVSYIYESGHFSMSQGEFLYRC